MLAYLRPDDSLTLTLYAAAGLFGAVVVAWLHARAGGVRLLPHLARSFNYSLFTGLVFTAPVAIVVATDPAAAIIMRALPLITLATAIALDVVWVFGSVAALLLRDSPGLTVGGAWSVAIGADIVALFVLPQYVGLRRSLRESVRTENA